MVSVSTLLLAANAVILLTGRYPALKTLYVAGWFITAVPATFLVFYTLNPWTVAAHLALFPAILALYKPGHTNPRNEKQDVEAEGDLYRVVPQERLFRDVNEIEDHRQ